MTSNHRTDGTPVPQRRFDVAAHVLSPVAGVRATRRTPLVTPHATPLLDGPGLVQRCATALAAADQTDGTTWTVNVVSFDDLRELRLALGGHAAETVLTEAARRLAQLPGAVVARLDRDTLAVVRPVTTGAAGDASGTGLHEGIALRTDLLEPVQLPDLGRGLQVRPETSVGVACVPDHGRDLEQLIAAADVAVTRAATAPARVAVAEDSSVLDLDALALHAELPAAVTDGQLRVFYQPLVAAGTHRMLGVEALVRWQHPERGLLGPGAFIPLAERSQAIVGLTTWVLRTAVAQCAVWRAAGHDLGVSVNISAAVLADPSFVGTVRAVLAEHPLDRGVLTLEVTESALLADPVGAAAVLAALRAAGARISLDDFGTGYTSLTMLRQLEADELKIDRSFVAAAPQAPTDAAIVRALVDLAHRLSMEVVAEGVEDARTADLVRSLGADVLQGFHFARPVPAEQVFTVLAAGSPGPAPVDVPWTSSTAPRRAPRPADEAERARLAHSVLTCAVGAEGLLRRVTGLAAAVCGAEFASFNVVTEEHVHLLAGHGHGFTRVARDGTPCAWAVVAGDLLEVRDCGTDSRLTGGDIAASGIRHYVGVPVVDAHGRTLGVLCAYDRVPLTVTDVQRTQLQVLAGVVGDHLQGLDDAGLLDRVHRLLQVMAEVERAEDDCRLLQTFSAAVHDLLRPDVTLLVRPTPVAERWGLLSHLGELAPDVSADVVYDTNASSAVARAVTTGRPVWVPDTTTSSVVDTRLAARIGAASVFTVPVVTKDGTRFVVSANWRSVQHDLHPVLRAAAVAAAVRTAHRLAPVGSAPVGSRPVEGRVSAGRGAAEGSAPAGHLVPRPA